MREFKNRKASHNYFFIDELEVGIVLKGSEIKSIRAGKINFKDSYAVIEDDEIWLLNLHISSYKKANRFDHEPERKRKLLLNKREIRKLKKKVEERGFTLVPKDLYINENGIAKLTLAVAKGKRLYDKRETLQKKDEIRELQRRQKNYL
ncbi:MAG: SsrA-binding protein SmpB [Candidatus Cloacimonetes bacterium]|nr:SsrA-binding protein SmpB [Candidatus Cloacimonadota bacterium]MCF7814288.1 SsrA-binding protein SmpB [Candidatus Cloacimonadota bacterium]MCF7868883.1 SsrA-binding protein SmpB [Candidatus Cloacimonadota bacterium]MCF7884329.1 SsrA-binding protein SmpB [Candidatus Cloacimonadota bacterium]